MGDGKGRRRLRARVLLLVASAAVMLALGEVAARIFEASARTAAAQRAQGDDRTDGEPVFETMLEIARPNLDGIHNGVRFRTNGEGVRGPAIAARAAPGTARILIVGDSVTMGAGVLETDAYVMQVAGLLGRDVETINGGLSGLNAKAVMDRLDRLDEAYAPDLLVYGFTINDVEGPEFVPPGDAGAVVRLWAKAARHRDSASALVRRLWPRWVMLQERLSPTLGKERDAFVYNHLENPQAFAAVEHALDRLRDRAAAGDRCAVVFIHTHLSDLDASTHPYLPVYEKIEAASRARGLHPIPSFSAFEGERAATYWLSFLDPHPNAAGHARLAAALAEGLAALPAACWPPHP